MSVVDKSQKEFSFLSKIHKIICTAFIKNREGESTIRKYFQASRSCEQPHKPIIYHILQFRLQDQMSWTFFQSLRVVVILLSLSLSRNFIILPTLDCLLLIAYNLEELHLYNLRNRGYNRGHGLSPITTFLNTTS